MTVKFMSHGLRIYVCVTVTAKKKRGRHVNPGKHGGGGGSTVFSTLHLRYTSVRYPSFSRSLCL